MAKKIRLTILLIISVGCSSFLLADEPTANLDSKTGGEILELMLKLNQKTSATFIFSTHDKMVMDFARRIIRLRDGKIESDQKVS